MRMGPRAKVVLCTTGVGAAAVMALLGVQEIQPNDASPVSVPAAQTTMQFGETVTQSAPPSQPDTPAATPPVKAQPAPTAEPG